MITRLNSLFQWVFNRITALSVTPPVQNSFLFSDGVDIFLFSDESDKFLFSEGEV